MMTKIVIKPNQENDNSFGFFDHVIICLFVFCFITIYSIPGLSALFHSFVSLFL